MGMMVGVAVGWALKEETERHRPDEGRELRWRSDSTAIRASSSARARRRLLIDPFLKPNNPAAVVTAEEVEPTHIAITHGHVDHMADAVPVATRTGAHCVAIVELAELARRAGRRDASATRTSAAPSSFDWGWVKLVPAWHTSTIPGSEEAPFSAEHGIVDRHRRRA